MKYIWERDYWRQHWDMPGEIGEYYARLLRKEVVTLTDENVLLKTRLAILERTYRALRKQTQEV